MFYMLQQELHFQNKSKMYISSSIADFKQTKQNTKQLWRI